MGVFGAGGMFLPTECIAEALGLPGLPVNGRFFDTAFAEVELHVNVPGE